MVQKSAPGCNWCRGLRDMSDDMRWFQDKEHLGGCWAHRPCSRVLVTAIQEMLPMLEESQTTLGCPCSISASSCSPRAPPGPGSCWGYCSRHRMGWREVAHPCGELGSMGELLG